MQGTGFINGGIGSGRDGLSVDNPFPVIVRTILNIQRDSMDYWQNMTCLFNKYWYHDPVRSTLPFCFFHVMKYSETHTADLSQQRVILYEPPRDNPDLTNPIREGLMQAVVDNIVIQPKEYKMEIVIPFMPFGRYVREGNHVASIISNMLQSSALSLSKQASDFINMQLQEVIGPEGYVKKSQDVLGDSRLYPRSLIDETSEGDMREVMRPDNMVNKNSLDAMFEQGRILQFKTWMGTGDYKYIVITNKTLEKRSNEDEVWRGDITMREIPILSLTPVTGKLNPVTPNWIINPVDKAGELMGMGRGIHNELRVFQALPEDTSETNT